MNASPSNGCSGRIGLYISGPARCERRGHDTGEATPMHSASYAHDRPSCGLWHLSGAA